MARSYPILKDKEYLAKRTFHPFAGGYSSLPVIDPVNYEYFKAAVDQVPETQDRYSSRPTRELGSKFQNATNRAFLDSHRGHLSTELRNILAPSKAWGVSFKSESPYVSLFMLNEFLAQTDHSVFKDFLDASWDEHYDKAVRYMIHEYPHTLSVYSHYNEASPFVMRPWNTKKLQAVYENLTREQLLALVKNEASTSVDDRSIADYFELAIKRLNSSELKLRTVQQLKSSLLRAFAKSIAVDRGHTELNLPAIYSALLEVLEKVPVSSNSKLVNPGLFQREELEAIADYLEANAEEFSVAEMFFLLYTLKSRKPVIRNGHVSDYSKLFAKIVRFPEPLPAVKFLAGITIHSTTQAPTLKQWERALEEGELENIVSRDITLALMLDGDEKEDKPAQELTNYRKTLGGKN